MTELPTGGERGQVGLGDLVRASLVTVHPSTGKELTTESCEVTGSAGLGERQKPPSPVSAPDDHEHFLHIGVVERCFYDRVVDGSFRLVSIVLLRRVRSKRCS